MSNRLRGRESFEQEPGDFARLMSVSFKIGFNDRFFFGADRDFGEAGDLIAVNSKLDFGVNALHKWFLEESGRANRDANFVPMFGAFVNVGMARRINEVVRRSRLFKAQRRTGSKPSPTTLPSSLTA